MSSEELTATEEADMADCDGDKVVTMMDVLQEQQDFEEDANAVLGASDEKNCTYPKGYIKRQALYACLTCCPDAKIDPTKRAGVCLACSLACHESHELVELYTKRNFCCDCGNSKFSSHPCQFTSNKPDLNENNSYNQNFNGLYCICHRPYPDPEAPFEDEMIQCVICEDWLHASHLEAKVPSIEQYSEMICKDCMEKNEFLYDYSDLAINAECEDVDVTTLNEKVNGVCNGDSEINGLESDINKENSDNADVDMSNVSTKVSDEGKKSDHTQMEVEEKQTEQVDEKEQDEKEDDADNAQKIQNNDLTVNQTTENNDSTVNQTTEKDICFSEKSVANVKAADNNVESKSEQHLESGKNKPTDEQNSSILNDKLDGKTEQNINCDEKVETTTEEDNVKPDSSKPTQNKDETTEVAKDEDKITSQFGKETNKDEEKSDKQDDSIEKDDLIESIDRIINGDNDESSKEKVDTTTDSGQDKSIEVKPNEIKNDEQKSSSEEKENVVVSSKNKDVELNDKKYDENQPQTGVEENILNKDDAAKANDTVIEPSKENKRKLDDNITDKTDVKKLKVDENSCKRPRGLKKHKGATFWPSNFREKLCTCNECLTMYKDLSVLFLIDLEDTVSAYETIGKEKNDGRNSQYEIGLQALSSLDRIQQINALTEYNKMRDKLLDFLKSFKDRKEIVKEEDIKAFFAGMKPKREPDGVYFCR